MSKETRQRLAGDMMRRMKETNPEYMGTDKWGQADTEALVPALEHDLSSQLKLQPLPKPTPFVPAEVAPEAETSNPIAWLLERFKHNQAMAAEAKRRMNYLTEEKKYGQRQQSLADIEKMRPFDTAIRARELARVKAQTGPMGIPPVDPSDYGMR